MVVGVNTSWVWLGEVIQPWSYRDPVRLRWQRRRRRRRLLVVVVVRLYDDLLPFRDGGTIELLRLYEMQSIPQGTVGRIGE